MNDHPETTPDKSPFGILRILRTAMLYAIPPLLGIGIAIVMEIPPRKAPETCQNPKKRYEKGKNFSTRWLFVKANLEAAFAWMKSAADTGSCPDAAYDAGRILALPEIAEEYGVPQDAEEGLRLLESAATNGHAKAAGLMALWYSGTNAERLGWPRPEGKDDSGSDLSSWVQRCNNREKAVEFAETAAAEADQYGLYVLGNAYRWGNGGKTVDMAKATEYYEKAANAGNELAAQCLKEVKNALAEPKPSISVTAREGLLGGLVLQFYNRSETLLVGKLTMDRTNWHGKARQSVVIKPNNKVEIGKLELDSPLVAGNQGSIAFDGHAWRLHFELITDSTFHTWFECGK